MVFFTQLHISHFSAQTSLILDAGVSRLFPGLHVSRRYTISIHLKCILGCVFQFVPFAHRQSSVEVVPLLPDAEAKGTNVRVLRLDIGWRFVGLSSATAEEMDQARWTSPPKWLGEIATGYVSQTKVVLGHSVRHFKPKLVPPLLYSSPITVR